MRKKNVLPLEMSRVRTKISKSGEKKLRENQCTSGSGARQFWGRADDGAAVPVSGVCASVT